MNRTIVGIVAAALLFAASAFAIPQHAAAQAFGGYADSLVFSVVPYGPFATGEIDMYMGSGGLEDDLDFSVKEAYGDFYGMLVNPVAPFDGGFNPFTIREIREAMHWVYDRDFLIKEIAGGYGTPMTAAHFSGEPDYVRDAAFFVALEIQYAYDPARAKAQVDAAMSRVPDATFDAATNKWLMNGAEIEVIIVQRVEDTRFEIGAYVATEVEKLGFTPVLDPSTFIEALDKVYFNDAKLGGWHIYTELWGTGDWVQFKDTQANFFYNGDFGSSLWNDYSPPAALDIACQTLNDGLYATLEERRDLLRGCVTEGMREGQRSFLFVKSDLYVSSKAVSNTVFDLFAGSFQSLAVRTTIKNGVAGGTLNIAQPVHTGSPWNLYGGFRDLYSRNQMHSITDFGTVTHPHLGVVIPLRADFTINNVGPLGTHDVPTSAMIFDTGTNSFVNVEAGMTTGAYVDFTMKWGEWHHGEMMSMDDVVAKIAMLSRMADGDLATANPNNAAQIYLTRWSSSFRGFEILDADSIRIYFDTYNPDESLIAGRIPIFPWYPWELDVIMAESVLAGETAFDTTSALLWDTEPLDLAKGPTLALFDPRLTAHIAANTIPPFLTDWVTSAEATARWAALNEWRHPAAGGCIDGPSVWSCNYYVSQGPYYLDQYFTAPEGALYTAKRSGYPIAQDAWDFLSKARVPSVVFGTPPEVIQTFPTTFQFTTSLDGAPYDRIQTTDWFLWDTALKKLLFQGDATRSGAGTWDIELASDQTAVLIGGGYELFTIVVGSEAAVPVVHKQAVTIQGLGAAVLGEVTQVLDNALADFRETLEDQAAETQGIIDSTNAQIAALASIVTLLLVVTIAAAGTAAVAIAALLVLWRRVRVP